jgi:glycosyltransferase involved in cell wall biosynthesis
MDDLGRYLTSRHHEVTTLSARPGPYAVESGPAGTRVLYPSRWVPALGRLRIQPTHTFFLSCYQALSGMRADIVHSFYFTDAAAAQMLQRRQGFKTVLQINGPPVPWGFHRLPPDRLLVRKVIQASDVVIACSQFVRGVIHEHYGVDAAVVLPLVDPVAFSIAEGPMPQRPTLLAVADFNQVNKGLHPLLRAFALLKEAVPEAKLRLSGRLSQETRKATFAGLPEAVLRDIEVLGLGKPEDVPRTYREATLLVLPSMWEASGTVMFEAWLSGIPVVATRHGGLPEFVAEDVGTLFDPQTNGQQAQNVEGLADAMRRGLALAATPDIRRRCREHAERYTWQRRGTDYERIYAG